jgi:hypothetical protein
MTRKYRSKQWKLSENDPEASGEKMKREYEFRKGKKKDDEYLKASIQCEKPENQNLSPC